MESRCRKMALHHKTSPCPHTPLGRQRTPYPRRSTQCFTLLGEAMGEADTGFLMVFQYVLG